MVHSVSRVTPGFLTVVVPASWLWLVSRLVSPSAEVSLALPLVETATQSVPRMTTL